MTHRQKAGFPASLWHLMPSRHRLLSNEALTCIIVGVLVSSTILLLPTKIILRWDDGSPFDSAPLRSSQPQTEGKTNNSSLVFLAGMVRDGTKMAPSVIKTLVKLNCADKIGIHIVTSRASMSVFDQHRQNYESCAPFIILKEDRNVGSIPNRVDRIAHVRDFQRENLRLLFEDRTLENDIVIVADLDLVELPSRNILLEKINGIIADPAFDVICSAGQTFNPYGYYDIFSTIVYPETFVYPVEGRLTQLLNDGENRSMVRSADVWGKFNQFDLMEYFEQEASRSPEGTVPVRSCFGGLALYRASKFLSPRCGYSTQSKDLMRFASRFEQRPCEHVIFHYCLVRTDPTTRIGLNPSLKTKWDNPKPYYSRLESGGDISRGLKESDGLFTYVKALDRGSRLVNGAYSLRINEVGSLVVEHSIDQSKSTITWSAPTNSSVFHHDWDAMFLILSTNGLLMLVQQVEMAYAAPKVGCRPFEKYNTMCRVAVWTSGTSGVSSPHSRRYVLELEDDGILRVYDVAEKLVLWSTATETPNIRNPDSKASIIPSYKSSGNDEIGSCIPSGDETTINGALMWTGSEAVLCKGAVFNISNPIVFSRDYQKLYTSGHPTGDKRALLRVTHESVVKAIIMHGRSNVELSSVVVDGNRPEFGDVKYSPVLFGGALISAGGSVVGQVISNIKAYEPRGWTCLHLSEGQNKRQRCNGAIVKDSEFGPSGLDKSATADGISLACRNSILFQNVITDTTNAGIVIFGAPGSVVEGNTIRAVKIGSRCGIKMVDFDPYKGSYNNTRVYRNTIDAQGAEIREGIAMGRYTRLACRESLGDVLFGATVSDNILLGDYMGHGMVVDGVRDWNVTGNVELAKQNGTPLLHCREKLEYISGGFTRNRPRSAGVFQKEFP